MPTAGYLQDAKNQQKRLAEIITAKGITATATEKYKDLVDKAAQIENLKGEEMTLENFTNALNEPKSIVQLEYPDNTPKILNAKLGSKNLFDKNNANIIAGYIDANIIMAAPASRCIYIPCNPNTTYTVSKIATARFVVAFTNVIPTAGTAVTNRVQNYTATSITATSGADSKYIVVWLYNGAYDTTTTIDEILATVQIELGSTATVYTPYISDLSTVTVTRCRKNLIPYPYTDTTKTLNGITFTVNADGSISFSGTSTGQATFYFVYKAMNLKQGVTYTLSASGNYSFGGSATIFIYDSAQGQSAYIPLLTDTSATFTPTKDVNNTNCYLVILANRTVSGTLKPQLELGSTATAYEPYQGQIYTPTATGEVTGITNLYPVTTLLTDNAGVLFEQVTGGFYKEILPSTDKNGITKVYQPSVDSTIDSNIKPENIKKGVKILGILGTYDGN